MKHLAVLSAAALGACVVVPKETTTIRVLGQGRTEPIAGALHGYVIETQARDRKIVITTREDRECSRQIYEDIELTKTKRLGIEGSGDFVEASGRMVESRIFAPVGLFLMLGGSVLGAVSLAVSGPVVIVSNISPDVSRARRTVQIETMRCLGNQRSLSVEVALPSGAIVEVQTDVSGTATFQVPSTEPARGSIRISASRSKATTQRYVESRAICKAERSRLMTLATTLEPKQRLAAFKSLPSCGKLTTGPDESIEDRVWSLTRTAAIAALEDRCELAISAAREVRTTAPAHFDSVLAGEVGIATCLSEAPRFERAHYAVELAAYKDCNARRATTARESQAIRDAGHRARALSSLPQCGRAPVEPE